MEKKIVKRNINYICGGIIIYNLIMIVIILIDFIIQTLLFYIQHLEELVEEEMSNELMDQFGQSGTSSIVAIAVGILFLLLYFYKSKVKDRIFYVNKPMQLRIFLLCTVMLMSTQQVFSWMSIGYEAALNLIGYTSMDAIESASEISYTVSMFLYASIFGPIAEEVVYRGFVMRNM